LVSISDNRRWARALAAQHATSAADSFHWSKAEEQIKRSRVAIAFAIPLLWLASWLSGCYVSQLSPTSHLVTVEPDGSVVRDECVVATQIAVLPPIRLECEENGVQVLDECNGVRCTYTRNGKVFRDCKITSRFTSLEYDCMENGVHIKRQCDRGWNTTTCYETKEP
jgi:hypothetical protein